MNRSVALERLVVAAVPLLTGWGIWSYGLWDPWELDAAGAARFGRVPGVLAGCFTCLLAFLLLRRYFSRRAGGIASAVSITAAAPMQNNRNSYDMAE